MQFDLAPAEPWFTLSLLALAGLAAWSYRGLFSTHRHAAVLLSVLRAFILISVLLALYRPWREEAIADPAGRRLLVLFDASASMGMSGTDGRPRSEPLREAVANFIRQWDVDGEVSLYSFDVICRPAAAISEIGDTGGRTDLAGALQSVRGALGGMTPTAILVVTDGVSNREGDCMTAADRLQAPIFFLPPEAGDPGARILAASTPSAVSLGGKIPVTCRIAGSGSMVVALYKLQGGAEELIEKKTVTAGEHRFSVDARTPGIATYRIRVEGEDAYAADNSRTLALTVLPPRDVLLIAGRLSWEYKYLRDALESVEEPKAHIVVFDDTRAVYVAGEGRRFARPRDWNQELLSPIAVLIALDADEAMLPASAVEVVEELASAGRLGIAAEGTSLASSSPLAGILPLRARDTATSAGPLAIEVAEHPLARSAAGMIAGEGGTALQSAADAHSLASYANGGSALLVGRAGTSRAVLVGFETWKTAWLGGDSRAVRSFWRDVIDYISPSPAPRLRLAAPKQPVLPGEEALVELRGETSIRRAIVRLDGAGLSERKIRDDFKEIRLVPKSEGECRISVMAEDDSEALATTYVACVERGLEYNGTDSDPALMSAIATRTGGRIVDRNDLGSISSSVANRSTIIRRRRVELWDHPLLLLLLAAALASEWGIRRRLGFR